MKTEIKQIIDEIIAELQAKREVVFRYTYVYCYVHERCSREGVDPDNEEVKSLYEELKKIDIVKEISKYTGWWSMNYRDSCKYYSINWVGFTDSEDDFKSRIEKYTLYLSTDFVEK